MQLNAHFNSITSTRCFVFRPVTNRFLFNTPRVVLSMSVLPSAYFELLLAPAASYTYGSRHLSMQVFLPMQIRRVVHHYVRASSGTDIFVDVCVIYFTYFRVECVCECQSIEFRRTMLLLLRFLRSVSNAVDCYIASRQCSLVTNEWSLNFLSRDAMLVRCVSVCLSQVAVVYYNG